VLGEPLAVIPGRLDICYRNGHIGGSFDVVACSHKHPSAAETTRRAQSAPITPVIMFSVYARWPGQSGH